MSIQTFELVNKIRRSPPTPKSTAWVMLLTILMAVGFDHWLHQGLVNYGTLIFFCAFFIALSYFSAKRSDNKLTIALGEKLVISDRDATLWSKDIRLIRSVELILPKGLLSLSRRALLIQCSDNDSYYQSLDYYEFSSDSAEREFLSLFPALPSQTQAAP